MKIIFLFFCSIALNIAAYSNINYNKILNDTIIIPKGIIKHKTITIDQPDLKTVWTGTRSSIKNTIIDGKNNYTFIVSHIKTNNGKSKINDISFTISDITDLLTTIDSLKNELKSDTNKHVSSINNYFTLKNLFTIGYTINNVNIQWYMKLNIINEEDGFIEFYDITAIEKSFIDAKSKIEELQNSK